MQYIQDGGYDIHLLNRLIDCLVNPLSRKMKKNGYSEVFIKTGLFPPMQVYIMICRKNKNGFFIPGFIFYYIKKQTQGSNQNN